MTSLTSTLDLAAVARRTEPAAGAVTGAPHVLLRLEGAVAMGAALAAYAHFGQGWGLFALLFLVPDLSMLGYLAGPRAGAAAYNAAHTYSAPAVLAGLGITFAAPTLIGVALIWAAHIGFDRLLGYGLKYATAFGHTHLGARGKARA